MMRMNEKQQREFYYGTSDKVNVGEWLIPSVNARKSSVKLFKKVQVTDNLDAAIYYAKRASEKDGGNPVVYIVEPEKSDLLKKNRTDYITPKAKIISIKNIGENA